MTATTTHHETEPGPVVVPAYTAMTSAVDRFLQAENAMRESLEPLARMTLDLGAEAARVASVTETISRQVTATTTALERLTRQARPGRSEDLSHLTREARRIARGNTRISVTVARYVSFLHARGRHYTADLVALALRGDADARAYWEDALAQGDPDALVVVTVLEDLDGMREDADALAAEVAHLVASATLTDLPETAEPIPPPRLCLAGSIDLCAPPAQTVSATAGNVLPAERSPMR